MKHLKKLFVIILFLSIIMYSSTCFAVIDEPSTYSPTCLIMEMQTGKVIYNKNGYEKVFPASTTKIMTAILAVENCKLDDVATASYEAIFTVPWDYTNADIQVGEQLTIEQLLKVLLIPSANEAANILAEHISGSVSSFVTMMNSKAIEIGCQNTHFVNANGIHNQNHYSTAYDLALIGRYAMQYEAIRNIVSMTSYTLPATNKFATNDRYFANTNDLIHKSDENRLDNYYYEYCTGIKTGYTSKAGSCIVASSKKDDKEYIVVVLGGEDTDNGLSGRNLDCITLFNYAFDNFYVKNLHEKNSILKTLKVKNAGLFANKLDVKIKDDISVVISNDVDLTVLTPTVEIDNDLKAPITKDSKIGTITYKIGDNTYSSSLIAGNDIKEGNPFTSIFIIFVVIILLYLLFKPSKSKKNKKKRKKNNSYKY